MSDLTALSGMTAAGVLLKGHQGNVILYEHTGWWKRYHVLSQNNDRGDIQDSFVSLFNEISSNPVEKARPDLIRDWTLARSFLLSRARSQATAATPEPVQPTPEKNSHQQDAEKSARKREGKQQAEQDTQPGKEVSEQKKNSRKLKKRINGLEPKELQEGVKAIERAVHKIKQKTDSPLSSSADEDQQLSHLINHLDISLGASH